MNVFYYILNHPLAGDDNADVLNAMDKRYDSKFMSK